jgi:hypothetical protein
VVINSWDITYSENLKKYEKKTARFVIDESEDAAADNLLRFGSDLTIGMRRLKRGYDKKKSSDANSLAIT